MVRLDIAFGDRTFKNPDSKKGPSKAKGDPVHLAKSQATKANVLRPRRSDNDDVGAHTAGRYTSVSSLSSLTSLVDVVSPPRPVSLVGGNTGTGDETVVRIRRVDLELGLLIIGVLVLLWILFSVGGRIARLEKRIDRLVEVVAAR